MTKRKPLSILIASLFLATPAVAQNVNWQDPLTPLLPVGWITQGEITIAPIYTDMDSKDPSKAIEYRDLDNGALSNILLRGRSTAGQWYDFFGENFGREDMYIEPPRRAVRRLEEPAVLGLDPPRARHQHAHAAARRAECRPPQPLPAAEPR